VNNVLRTVTLVLAAVMLSGCSVVWNEGVGRQPKITPAPTSTPIPYKAVMAPGAKCERLSKAQLSDFQDAAAIGGAVKYTNGVAVKANDQWSVVVLHTEVYANPFGYARDNVAATDYWIADTEALDPESWSLNPTFARVWDPSSDPLVAMAAACLQADLAKAGDR
jgi:hypothetical protein